jgi:hypothetical protein
VYSNAPERWAKLVSAMYAVVHEEWLAWRYGCSRRSSPHREEVTHGPWLPSECQSVLGAWHEAGWIELIADFEHPGGRHI